MQNLDSMKEKEENKEPPKVTCDAKKTFEKNKDAVSRFLVNCKIRIILN